MSTDPTPDGVAGTPTDAMKHLVKRAVRPIDIEHDQLMARAEAEHQARVTADQARVATDRAAVLLEGVEAIDQLRATLAPSVAYRYASGLGLAATELRRLAAGERDEQQAQQGGATILAELQQHLTDHTPSCNARTDHLMRRAAWALGMPRPAHVGGNAEDCPGCEGTNPPYPFICPGPPATAPAEQPPADTTGEEAAGETVHGCPPDGSGLTPCCGRTPLELPLSDRISSEVPVTCKGADRD